MSMNIEGNKIIKHKTVLSAQKRLYSLRYKLIISLIIWIVANSKFYEILAECVSHSKKGLLSKTTDLATFFEQKILEL